MAAGTVDAVLRALERGYRPYRGQIEGWVYENLGCRKASESRWFVRGELYLCLGCRRLCALSDPQGFQRMLPVKRRFAQVAFAEIPTVTVEELLKNKVLLRVDEAAWCLAISKREVYNLIDEGRLVRHRSLPIRVTASSIKDELFRATSQPRTMF